MSMMSLKYVIPNTYVKTVYSLLRVKGDVYEICSMAGLKVIKLLFAKSPKNMSTYMFEKVNKNISSIVRNITTAVSSPKKSYNFNKKLL
jgi:hypothetical protein